MDMKMDMKMSMEMEMNRNMKMDKYLVHGHGHGNTPDTEFLTTILFHKKKIWMSDNGYRSICAWYLSNIMITTPPSV
jgi:hypothetical protein